MKLNHRVTKKKSLKQNLQLKLSLLYLLRDPFPSPKLSAQVFLLLQATLLSSPQTVLICLVSQNHLKNLQTNLSRTQTIKCLAMLPSAVVLIKRRTYSAIKKLNSLRIYLALVQTPSQKVEKTHFLLTSKAVHCSKRAALRLFLDNRRPFLHLLPITRLYSVVQKLDQRCRNHPKSLKINSRP